jgi:hypothetical protein
MLKVAALSPTQSIASAALAADPVSSILTSTSPAPVATPPQFVGEPSSGVLHTR